MQVLNTAESCQRAMEETPDCVLVFSASWCGPCKALKPHLEKVASTMMHVLYVDVDEAPEFTQAFKVRSVPTVMLRRDGQIVESVTGCNPRTLYAMLKRSIDNLGMSPLQSSLQSPQSPQHGPQQSPQHDPQHGSQQSPQYRQDRTAGCRG